jgi:UDP-N-acetylglucosamine--N-acetylmuramyl-(pentapeptide) pyrophosphoryl-undecaprenol N-acetylglucosamine transferase
MNKKSFKILIAGGGTGGHLFSGIAVADLIHQNYPHAEILFVGTPYGLEKEIVPQAGFSLKTIEVSPLKGSGPIARIKSLMNLPQAYLKSKKILKEFRPDFVVGIGGYASGPMTLAAHFSKLPTAIIEQNSIPGFTNRWLARFVDKIFIAFDKAREFFPKNKIVFSGNPARKWKDSAIEKSAGKFCVFILGGSQGAHALNVAMLEALPYLGEEKGRLCFIHQTGPADFEQVHGAYERWACDAQVFPFLQDLGPAYAKADLMICRSGAGTITELQNLAKAAILVPYPFAADDHQFFNAKEMVEQGAAEIILNQDLSGKVFAERILDYLHHPEKIHTMEALAQGLAKPDAAKQVLDHCLALLRPSS